MISPKMLVTVMQNYLLLLVAVLMIANSINGLGDYSSIRSIGQKFDDEGHEGDCQVWYSYIKCTNKGTLLSIGHCMTYHEGQGTFAIECPYFQLKGHNVAEHGYIKLPSNVSELNDYMCGSMNRKGWLCKDCIDGFGPSVTSVGYKCANCTGVWYGVPLYLLQEFIPITLFFLLILTCRIHLTSAPMTCFIMYSQLRTIEVLLDPQPSMSDIINKPFFKVISAFYGVWNLDFIRYDLPAFCVSNSIQLTHMILLNYISSIYPFILILLTWLCIELHDRHVRLLVWLWRPFHHCFVNLRRKWDTRRDMIDVFSSFFLLSFSKTAYQSILLLQCPHLTRLSEDGNVSSQRAMAYNPSIICKSTDTKFLLIAIAASLSILVFSVFPALLLVLYPIKVFRVYLSKCRLNNLCLIIFVEKFHGCYRDGLNGGRDMRSLAGLYYFLRLAPFFFRINKHIVVNAAWSYLLLLFLASTLLIALVRPYKKMYLNVVDTFLLADLTLLSYFSTRCYFSGETWHIMMLTSAPAILYGGLALYKVGVLLKAKQRLANIWQLCWKEHRNGKRLNVEWIYNSESEETRRQNQPLLSPTSIKKSYGHNT